MKWLDSGSERRFWAFVLTEALVSALAFRYEASAAAAIGALVTVSVAYMGQGALTKIKLEGKP